MLAGNLKSLQGYAFSAKIIQSVQSLREEIKICGEENKNIREENKTEYERMAREMRNSREESKAEIASLNKSIQKIETN